MANAISTGRQGGCGGKGLTSRWSFIGCIRLSVKLIHPRWQPTVKGAKDEMHSFYPPPSTTYFISWPLSDRAIHYLLYPFPLTHTTHNYTHMHQSAQNILYYQLGIYIAFRLRGKLCLSLGTGLHHSCAQAVRHGCKAVGPLIHSRLRMHSKLWHRQEITAVQFRV